MDQFLNIMNRYLKIPRELIIVSGVVSIIGIIIVPLPSPILDFLLLISLAIGMLVLMISIYIKNPTSLTMFPTLILVVTLYRLALNIATTRTILTEGHNGPDSVSQIITAFGNFVVGGNYVVGIVIFVILVLINFMVITKGSTRVAEVNARFTLDSMPGKQMSIDAALSQGIIDDKEAQRQRDALAQEVDFYGSMDGSSKFVKGDAVAGIIITLVNVIGGILIGLFQNSMDLAASAQTYTLLTIGDGLVSQIPALLLSTATGILITKSTKDDSSFAGGVSKQLSQNYQTYLWVGSLMWLFTLIPGFPVIGLMILGTLFLFISFSIYRTLKLRGFIVYDKLIEFIENNEYIRGITNTLNDIKIEEEKFNVQEEEKMKLREDREEQSQEPVEEESLINTNALELVFGYRLANLANEGPLLEKLKGIKKTIAEDTGFVIPSIQVRDDNHLDPNEYVLKLKGVEVFRNKVQINKLLAIPGFGSEELENAIATKEPIGKMDAYWIGLEQKEEAIEQRYTIIDVPSLIVAHVMVEIKRNGPEIITRQDIVRMLDAVKATHPVIVESVMQNASYGLILAVIKELMKESVPITDLVTVLEVIADTAEHVKVPEIIVENVRMRLYRVLTNEYKSEEDGIIHIITLEGATEEYLLSRATDNAGNTNLQLDVNDIRDLITKTGEEINKLNNKGVSPYVLVVDPMLRKKIFEIFERFDVSITVMSHSELDPKVPFNIESNIAMELEGPENPDL